MLKNGEPVHSNAVLKAGDTLTLTLLETGEAYEKADLPFAVLYEDEDFLVLDKPYNMPVHPSPGHDRDSVLNAAAWYFQNTPDFVFRPLYRLDRDTTGALVLAKNKFAANAKLTKTYRAVCEGVPVPGEGDIDLPLGRAEGSLLKRCPDPQGLPAHTHYEVLAAANGRALLRLTPTTGRTHQLRVHLAAIGHPLTGDWLYGTEDRALIARPALHSYHLVMRHPLTGSSIDVTAPLPEDMQALLR